MQVLSRSALAFSHILRHSLRFFISREIADKVSTPPQGRWKKECAVLIAHSGALLTLVRGRIVGLSFTLLKARHVVSLDA